MTSFGRFLVAFCFLVSLSLRAALPDLVPVALQAPATITAAPNPSAQVAWAVTNQGNAEASGYWSDILYLSTNSVYDSSAMFLGYSIAPSPLQPGETYWSTNTAPDGSG